MIAKHFNHTFDIQGIFLFFECLVSFYRILYFYYLENVMDIFCLSLHFHFLLPPVEYRPQVNQPPVVHTL